MSNAAGSVHLVYNGEVYNFRELRTELEGLGHRFTTSCDAEVVLAAYERWGVECFPRFNGMWALAILDEREAEARLVLCRDHLGIKPLYVAEAGGRHLFASEIKALLAAPELEPAVDDSSPCGVPRSWACTTTTTGPSSRASGRSCPPPS